MSEGQETTGTTPVNIQDDSGQCTDVEEQSKQNITQFETQEDMEVCETLQDYQFSDEQKEPVKEAEQKEDFASPDIGGPGDLAEGHAMDSVEQAADCISDANLFVLDTQNVVEDKDTDADDLPSDWIKYKHINDIPIYMHKPTRVCTLSKPYIPQKGKIRSQEIPESAMPCEVYRAAFEDESTNFGADKHMCVDIDKPTTSRNDDTNNLDTTKEEIKDNVTEAGQANPGESVGVKNEERLNIDWYEMLGIIIECSLQNLNQKFNDLDDLVAFANTLPARDAIEIEYGEEDHEITNTSENYNKYVYSSNMTTVTLPMMSYQTLFVSDNLAESSEDDSGDTSDDQLTAEQITEYCKKLFKFKMVKQYQNSNWVDHRKYEKDKETSSKRAQEAQTSKPPPKKENKEYKALMEKTMLDANETSFMSMFNEYVYKEHQQKPTYAFKEIFVKRGDWGTFQATVYINKKRYGVGQGLSKRQAKYTAARVTLALLMHGDQCPECPDALVAADAIFFDYVAIDDPCVLEFCLSIIDVSPYAVLLNRMREENTDNYDYDVYTKVIKLEPGKIELKMKAGNFTSTVICKNNYIAHHRASQNILQEIHPDIRSWGSLLRWYSIQAMEKRLAQLKASKHANGKYKICIEKIEKEMMRLRKRDQISANAIMMRTGRSEYFPINEGLDM